ncbi:hypothetical protein [Streptomyces sp. NPDC006527]|uniref:hypothetical protein n=1 Tax=Streptomyces sp. NPDC006527 TaxID=3364749 RepID=UPI0036796C6C
MGPQLTLTRRTTQRRDPHLPRRPRLQAPKSALFLATGESSFITGTEIHVDGGANQI